ncbi:MAG: elongation factor P [Flavobacteriales bacterium]|nr:elongation factor P [Flavobacteriales bacterium]|tara:strand:- start:48957 stop:49523 length:567 start_codon:yes stop_codon:yes gene_type:complete
MATTADFKNGLCMKFNNDLFTILEFQHVKPGKGPAFVRTKLKSLTTGKIIDNTFNSGVKIEPIRVETRKYQYLFNDDSGYHFMNKDTFEQTFLPKEMINAPDFLKEGNDVEIVFHAEEERPLNCDLPPFVEMEITYTEPGIKGDTATNATKPAKIETGAEVRVPLFINEGDRIKIDTRTGAYVERVKN